MQKESFTEQHEGNRNIKYYYYDSIHWCQILYIFIYIFNFTTVHVICLISKL